MEKSGDSALRTRQADKDLRRSLAVVLIVVAAGMAAGRILNVQRVYEPGVGGWPTAMPVPMPTFGANDRSRWATIRALVDEGTYVIGRRLELPELGVLLHLGNLWAGGIPGLTPPPLPPFVDTGIMTKDGWRTIDKVMRPETRQFLSSKPPLLPTVLAGEYWVLQQAFGWTLKDNPWEVVRVILFTVNWLPFVGYLWLLSRLAERLGLTDWGRLFVLAAACFGTFLTTFLTTLNNHTVAAFSVLFALYPLILIWSEPDQRNGKPRWFALAGFFAAWTACSELPAAAFGVAVFLLLAYRDFGRTVLFFVPAALVPIGGFLLTNYLAVGTIMPIYDKFGTEWYNYVGSHWNNPRGIDGAKEPLGVYAFHLLLGHHGILSLSPVFMLALFGMLARGGRQPAESGSAENGGDLRPTPAGVQRVLSRLALVLTLIVFGFYLFKTNNYGGWTSGARWFFWLTPLWLLALAPVADRLAGCRRGRGLGCVLLGLSVLSVSYPAWNPWRHPWLYNLLDYFGVIRY